MPPSNGLISPVMPNFNRPNNNGMPPNMRNDLMYSVYMPPNSGRQQQNYQGNMPPPPMQHLPPNFQQAPNQFYTTVSYVKNKVQCTNCGMMNHTRNECPEPLDTSSSMSEYDYFSFFLCNHCGYHSYSVSSMFLPVAHGKL